MEITSAISEHCRPLEHPDAATVTLAAVILAGILVSYIPQHAKIILNHTSEGLSPWWVLLGGLSSIAALGNILTLPASRADIKCCREVNGGACAAALLGVGQIGLQWSCFMFIVMLFLIFFPVAPEFDMSSSTASLTSSPPPKRRDAVIVGSLTLLMLLVVGITSVALVAAWPHHTQGWANLLGGVAGVLAMVQYVPQIWYTYRLEDVKSLSVITMLIQVPGAFLFAFSLWQRVGWEGWSTWLVYIVTGILQACLLGLAIHYYRTRRLGDKESDSDDVYGGVDDVDGAIAGAEDSNERTALLGNGSGPTKGRPIASTQRSSRSNASQRQLSLLYAATPPDQDSDRS
ncbi:hypothetical protein LTR78_002070 [Recurvomyces mirabilis]|uniref:PQ loop repeat protein n=1 Tax=Recurvomyces mirabilis TaxID=574656 RepID=A0AAE1C4S9_9PEZI|nr:hypothetical protein LTR78_002070 [Recurvomyces mirabilis]KAK5160528.1 hypothetical protein LTS14_001540 [Recurvomyces mirabilis]